MQASNDNIKIVTTLTVGEKLLHKVFDDGNQKPLTVLKYCNHVMQLFKGLHAPAQDFDSFDWIKDSAAIIEYFDNAYSTKLSMQATGLNPLLVVVPIVFPSEQQLYDAYYKRYTAVREMMEKARPPSQVMTEAEFKN
jgi:hypothetical protein